MSRIRREKEIRIYNGNTQSSQKSQNGFTQVANQNTEPQTLKNVHIINKKLHTNAKNVHKYIYKNTQMLSADLREFLLVHNRMRGFDNRAKQCRTGKHDVA